MSACCGTKQVTTNLAPPDPTKHVNYVRGMVLEVDEFTQEFAYLSGRDRWLAREAIGYGTVRGLALSWKWEKNTAGEIQPQVMVTSGVALTYCGQLVCVPGNQCADINQWLTARDAEISARFKAGANSGDLTLYVTLAYSDCPTDDEPVPGEPCRSADELMQPSRITDSFQLELSYDAPPQAEEDAVRGFHAWLRRISIDPLPNKSVTPDKFMAAVRAWSTAASDPASLTISANDVPAYSTMALRLWVTELRVATAAFHRFKLWLYSVPHKTDGTATELEVLAEVHRWTPRTYSWPDKLIVNNNDKKDFITKALALWDTEITLKWQSEFCGCSASTCITSCDDRLLLGQLNFKVAKNAGNSWRVEIPDPLLADATLVDESRRPIIGHLRALQEQMIPTPESGSAVPPLFAPLHTASCWQVALGRIKSLQPGDPPPPPVFCNVRINGDIKDGEVRFTFDHYSKPASDHDYIVHVQASSTGGSSEPEVRFAGFGDTDFLCSVTRSGNKVPKDELEKMEFQIEVSIIVKA